MFETLTQAEARELRRTLNDAYFASRSFSKWTAAQNRFLVSEFGKNLVNRQLNEQAAMRSEIMGIRNQLSDEMRNLAC